MTHLAQSRWHTTFMSRNPSRENNEVFHWVETELGEFQAYDNDGEECLLLLPNEIQGHGVWVKNLEDAKDTVKIIRRLHAKKQSHLKQIVQSFADDMAKLWRKI